MDLFENFVHNFVKSRRGAGGDCVLHSKVPMSEKLSVSV
jgi:hypothetical protein